MQSIEIKARAKINLSLDVLRKRPDNYHDLEMIMQTIELHDIIRMEVIPEGIDISCNMQWVPTGPENTAYKAANLILGKYKINKGVKIRIEKKIPVAAGLAGGSSNAAAVLRGVSALFSLPLDTDSLADLGRQIGADVPFCIKGGTMLAQGIGDVLTPLKSFPPTPIVLVKPRIGVSTPWVYKNLKLDSVTRHPDTKMLVDAVNRGDVVAVAGNMCNVLETVTIPKYGIIAGIKEKLQKLGAAGSMMSGSGPTVFGIFKDAAGALYAYENIKDEKLECFVTGTFNEER